MMEVIAALRAQPNTKIWPSARTALTCIKERPAGRAVSNASTRPVPPDSSQRKPSIRNWHDAMSKFRTAAPLLALLVFASCADETSGVTSIGPRTFGAARGVDMARDARDNLNELKQSRLDFIARYYRDPASRWPTLSASEA